MVGHTSSGPLAGQGAPSLKLALDPGVVATPAASAERTRMSVRRFIDPELVRATGCRSSHAASIGSISAFLNPRPGGAAVPGGELDRRRALQPEGASAQGYL